MEFFLIIRFWMNSTYSPFFGKVHQQHGNHCEIKPRDLRLTVLKGLPLPETRGFHHPSLVFSLNNPLNDT